MLAQPALAALLLLAPAPADKAPAGKAAAPAAAADAEAALRSVDAAFLSAFNRKDAATIARLYTADAVLFDPGPALVFHGPDEVRKGLEEFFAEVQSVHLSLRDTRYVVSGDLGGSAGLFDIAMVGKDGKEMKMTGRTTSVYRREGGQWRFLFDHASLPLPPPPAPGAPAPAPAPAK